jgi:hypothetical protein
MVGDNYLKKYIKIILYGVFFLCIMYGESNIVICKDSLIESSKSGKYTCNIYKSENKNVENTFRWSISISGNKYTKNIIKSQQNKRLLEKFRKCIHQNNYTKIKILCHVMYLIILIFGIYILNRMRKNKIKGSEIGLLIASVIIIFVIILIVKTTIIDLNISSKMIIEYYYEL